MSLLNDIHHLAFVTADMDRLIDFYARMFDAQLMADLDENGVRHAFIEVGPHTVLHPFQIPGVDPPGEQPMFQRGRLDHFALSAASKEAFLEVRRRLVAEGATDGEVTEMGAVWVLTFSDPDRGRQEVVWPKPGVPVKEGLKRSDWTRVDVD